MVGFLFVWFCFFKHKKLNGVQARSIVRGKQRLYLNLVGKPTTENIGWDNKEANLALYYWSTRLEKCLYPFSRLQFCKHSNASLFSAISTISLQATETT